MQRQPRPEACSCAGYQPETSSCCIVMRFTSTAFPHLYGSSSLDSFVRPDPSCRRGTAAAKNVLILHNWSNLPQSWSLMESTVRARVPGQINFYTSTVENPRFDDEAYRESLAETLRRGYSGVKLDLVVAANLQVLRFVMQYRDHMFPGVPIVFTDVGDQEDLSMSPAPPPACSAIWECGRPSISRFVSIQIQIR